MYIYIYIHIKISLHTCVSSVWKGICNFSPYVSLHFSYGRGQYCISNYNREYAIQSICVTGADYWWFYSFCPNIKEYALKVHRDDYTENLSKSLQELNSLYETRKNETVELQTQ